MLSPDRVCDHEPLSHAAADYDVVRRAIACWAKAATSPVITGASRANARCWAGKRQK